MKRRASARAPSLRQLYRRLLRALGPQHWWPAQTPFEVMVGAILTQSTNWHNVERAIANLKAARALSAQALAQLRSIILQRLIRPSGYFRQKAARLQTFSRWYLSAYGASVRRMSQTPVPVLRRQLFAIPGIGPETADSILLYAGRQPVVVVDAYTRRIFRRHRLITGDEPYDAIQRMAMDRLPDDPAVLNEFHALLVAVGKRYCHRHDPDCVHCPLGDFPRTLEVIPPPTFQWVPTGRARGTHFVVPRLGFASLGTTPSKGPRPEAVARVEGSKTGPRQLAQHHARNRVVLASRLPAGPTQVGG